MPVKPRETVEVPLVSVPEWIFGTPSCNLPDEPLILDPSDPVKRHLSLRSYRYWSQRFAAGLQAAGHKVGQRVLFISDNCTAWPIVFMGIIMAGGVVSGQSASASKAKLLDQAFDTEPAFIFTSENGLQVVRDVAKSISLSEECIYLFDDEFLFERREPKEVVSREGRRHWAALLKETSEPFDWTKFTSPEQLAVISFTSGSTGKPKGVLLSHYNMVANAVQYVQWQTHNPTGFVQGRGLAYVMWSPMYHIIGTTQFCMILPRRGVVNYIMTTFDLDKYLAYTEKYRATDIFLTPAPLIAILSHPTVKTMDLSSVQTIHVGGAPLRDSTLQRLRELMPNKSLAIRETFGMTEYQSLFSRVPRAHKLTARRLTGVVIGRWPLTPEHMRSHGELLPNCMAKVLTPDGKAELVANEPGELYVKSPNVARGYVNRPDATTETFLEGGWLKTGDLAYYDSEYNFHIRDRIQDVIFHENGCYALPTDLESSLISIPGVEDAGIALVDPSRPHEQLRGGIFEIEEIPRLPVRIQHPRGALRHESN